MLANNVMLSAWLGVAMQFFQLKRRDFITLIGGAAAASALPVRARAQMGKTSRIGSLGTSSPSLERHLVDAFRQKLRPPGCSIRLQ
jgi:hypothetical protein